MENLILKADIFGQKFNLQHNGSERYRTYSGVVTSFIIIGIGITFGIIFGLEVTEKNKPTVTSSQETRPISEVPFEHLNMTFHIFTATGIDLTPNFDSILEMGLVCFNDQIGDSFVPCDGEIKVDEYYGKGRYATFKKPMIITDDAFTDNTGITLGVSFKKCNPKTSKTCDPNLDSYFNYLNLIVSHDIGSLDPINYSNPISSSKKRHSVQIGNKLGQRLYFEFFFNILNSDNGWILEDYVQSPFLALDVKENPYIIESIETQNVIEVIISSPRKYTKINRNYIKIQDVAAKVGGLINIVVLVFDILLDGYFRFNFLMFVRKELLKRSLEKTNGIFNENNNEIEMIKLSKIEVNPKKIEINPNSNNEIQVISNINNESAFPIQSQSNLLLNENSNFKIDSNSVLNKLCMERINNIQIVSVIGSRPSKLFGMNTTLEEKSLNYLNYLSSYLLFQKAKKNEFERLIEQIELQFQFSSVLR